MPIEPRVSRPLPTLPGVYYGRVVGAWEGLPSSNIFCYKTDAIPPGEASDAANATAVAEAMAAHWPAFALISHPTSYAASEAVVYPLGHPTVPASVVGFLGPGGGAGNLAPAATAILIKEVVYRRGKGSQSRTYISPVAAELVTADGKDLLASAATDLQAAYNTFQAAMLSTLNALSAGVWSYVQVSKLGTGATYPIISDVAELALSTQRRRARRRG